MVPMTAPAEPDAIPLRTGSVTGQASPEVWFRQYNVAMTRNVSTATLTPVLPDPAKATGAAAIVAPGGGFLMLSMENEGWRVARALADRGIAAFVLKYRLKPTPADPAAFERALTAMFAGAGRPQSRLSPDAAIAGRPQSRLSPDAAIAGRPQSRLSPDAAIAGLGDQLADTRAAIALVRARAGEWHVDPARVGMIGFSAGAMATMATALAKPDMHLGFIAPIYGSMEPVTVPADAPPMFAALAANDPLFAGKGLGLIESWQRAGRPVELHLYQAGGHGFGLGKAGTTSTGWFDSFVRWLDANGLLAAKAVAPVAGSPTR